MKTILLADDEANLRLLVRTTLSDPRFRIVEASDGREALQLAKAESPDAIVLDWMMPGLSGIEVAAELRKDPLTRGIPIIMLTARGQEADREHAERLEVSTYLVKPFSPLELLQRVDDLFR